MSSFLILALVLLRATCSAFNQSKLLLSRPCACSLQFATKKLGPLNSVTLRCERCVGCVFATQSKMSEEATFKLTGNGVLRVPRNI